MVQGQAHPPSDSREIPGHRLQEHDRVNRSNSPQTNTRSLTPVRIRGKKSSAQQPAMNVSLKAAVNPPSTPKRGRRLSPAAIPFSPSRKTHHTRRLEKTPLWAPSRLESLPTEVLEVIFLYTVNISLPRASLRLGQKLSSDYVHKELLLRTCSSQRVDDDDLFRTEKERRYIQRENKERANLQSLVLRQKWLTLDFLRRWIPDYMASTLLRELTTHKLHWLDPGGPLVTYDLEPIVRTYIADITTRSLSREIDSGLDHYFEEQWTETSPANRKVILGLSPQEGLMTLHMHNLAAPLPSTFNDLKPTTFYTRFRILSLSPQAQIPVRLLRGPWSSSKIELLELLVRGNASIDWIATTAGEVAENGFLDAIYEGNARALRALCVCTNDTTPGERKDAGYNVIPTRGVGVIPEQKHLLLAVQHGCREDVVETLINAPKSRVDLQQSDLTRLLIAMHGQHHPQTRWLRDRVEVDRTRRLIPDGSRPRSRASDYLGKARV